jgi:YD repeat-containing protein
MSECFTRRLVLTEGPSSVFRSASRTARAVRSNLHEASQPLRRGGRNLIRLIASWFLLCTLVATHAYATSQCLQFSSDEQDTTGSYQWYDSPLAAGQGAAAWCTATNANCNSGGSCCTWDDATGSCSIPATCTTAVTRVYPNQGWDGGPGYNVYTVAVVVTPVGAGRSIPKTATFGLHARLAPSCQVFVTPAPPPQPQCGPTCTGVSEPINPASGAVYDTIVELPSSANSLSFKRYYNSSDISLRYPTYLNPGWRHSFSRTIQPRYASSDYLPYTANAGSSSLYTDEATACTSGFAEIEAGVSTWANASASYANGVCALSVGSTQIGTLTIHYTIWPSPNPSALILVGFDALRDDGQLVSFNLRNGALVAPPGITLQMQQTSSGFTLTDPSDTVEAYDSTGRLLTVTSRAGVVQTMNYDTSARLSTVTDNFGHKLTLSYDSQGRLSSVTQQ